MIKLSNLIAKRKQFKLDVDSLELKKGENVAVLGNNGSGKSTFLSVLSGFLKFEGDYQIEGKGYLDFDNLSRNRLIGFLPQKTTLNMPFDVFYVILTGRFPFTNGYHYQATDYQKTEETIRQFDIEHLQKRPFNELSGGEKQRVLMARIFNRDPEILLLDEPLNGIDLRHQHEAIELLKKINPDKTVLVVMHDLSLALREFDRFLVFSEGKLVYNVMKNEIDPTRLASIFNIKIDFIEENNKLFINTGLH